LKFFVAIGLIACYLLLVIISAQADWSIQTGAGLAYTDHVFHFSSAFEQELLEDPTFPDPASLGKQDDVIWEPSLQGRWSPSGNGTPTELGFKALGFIYTNHPNFNHGDFRFHVRQKLSQTNSIKLRYQAEPDVFLQPNFESRTGRRTIQDQRVSSHIGSFEFEQRLGKRWDVMLESRFGVRLYNEPFAQRDTRFWTVGPALTYALTDQVKFIAGYLFERGLADGRDDARFNDDVSYVTHLLSVGLDAEVNQSLSLHLSYVYKRKLFTTDLAADPEHFNRRDDSHQGNIDLRYKMTERANLVLGFKRTERSSTNPLFPYKSNVVSLAIQYRF
jgi:hypothetical protein